MQNTSENDERSIVAEAHFVPPKGRSKENAVGDYKKEKKN